MFPMRIGSMGMDPSLLWTSLMMGRPLLAPPAREVPPEVRAEVIVGEGGKRNPIEMRSIPVGAPLDSHPGILVISVIVDARRFCTLICCKDSGFDENETVELPPSLLSVCRVSPSGNLSGSSVHKKIACGEEIVLLPSKAIATDSGGFVCERCGKVFSYAYYRDKHLKYTRCVDRGDRKFPCALCTRSFEKRDRLRIHVLHVHENHRPHMCTVCGKSFSQSSSLNKHLRVHSGERPYKCSFCPKAFTASSILRTHIRQHSGEKPFKCSHCGKPFASHAAHDSHVRRTHPQGKDG